VQEKYININKLKVSESLSRFVKDELLKDTNISSDDFWLGFEKTVEELEPKNRQLINFRETLQKKIDAWHIKNKSNEFNLIEYKKFLVEIGYLKKEGPDFSIETKNVDDEITKIAGPQLVVPIMNSRYALNAANARWMSLYDSLYGTDVIEQSEDSVSERYDPLRGEMVIKYGRDFLDKYFPLKDMSWSKITTVAVKEGSFKSIKRS
jgi:malate synthase